MNRTDRKQAHRPTSCAVAALLALLAGSCMATPARAQGNGLTLGSVSAAAKGKVIVPFMLELESEEVRVGRISATVGYDANIATFEQAEKGFLLDGVGGKLTATAKVDGEKSSIAVEVLTEGEPRKPLRKGLVLSLVFKVNEQAASDTKMPLALSGVKLTTIDSDPKPVEPLQLANGEIHVLAPENVPFVSCFFFTH